MFGDYFYLVLYYKEGTYDVSIEHMDLKQIEEIYIPDSIARIENISWNDLNDRPFYEENGRIQAIVPETEIYFGGANFNPMDYSNHESIPGTD
jgi:hypothetical protein